MEKKTKNSSATKKCARKSPEDLFGMIMNIASKNGINVIDASTGDEFVPEKESTDIKISL